METNLEQSIKENYLPNSKTECKDKIKYEKPLIEKQEKMTFPMDIIESFNSGRFCVQCSGCHGCR